jgi:hypothetical protein
VTACLEVLVLQLEQPVGEEAEVVGDTGYHAPTVRAQQRAVVGGLDDREFFDPLLHAVGDGVQDASAFGPRRCGPGGEGGLRGGHGCRGLQRRAAGDLTDRAAVDRRDIGERLGGGDAPAADPVPGVDGNAAGDDVVRHKKGSN